MSDDRIYQGTGIELETTAKATVATTCCKLVVAALIIAISFWLSFYKGLQVHTPKAPSGFKELTKDDRIRIVSSWSK